MPPVITQPRDIRQYHKACLQFSCRIKRAVIFQDKCANSLSSSNKVPYTNRKAFFITQNMDIFIINCSHN